MKKFDLRRWWVMAPLAIILAACAVAPSSSQRGATPNEPGGSASGEFAPGEVSPGERWSAYTANPAVVALLDRAAVREQAGLYEQAAAALERALRLEPRNAMLWHRLASVRLIQGQWQDAVELAAKSNSLAAGNADLRGSNWAVIAEAKERQGDRQGAQEARTRMEAEGVVR